MRTNGVRSLDVQCNQCWPLTANVARGDCKPRPRVEAIQAKVLTKDGARRRLANNWSARSGTEFDLNIAPIMPRLVRKWERWAGDDAVSRNAMPSRFCAS